MSGPGCGRVQPKVPDQRVEDRQLALDQPGPGCGLGGPFRAVDLGEAADRARSPRPLQLEGVAYDAFGLEVRFRREDRDDLAGGLAEVAEPVVLGGGCRCADFLRELAVRGRQGVLLGEVFPLGDGPAAGVLAGPERSAHVGYPELKLRCAAGWRRPAGRGCTP